MVSWETGRNQVSVVVAGREHEMAETVHHGAGETAVQPAGLTPETQIKAAKKRGILTAKLANHAKGNDAEQRFEVLTAGTTAQRFMAGKLMAGK